MPDFGLLTKLCHWGPLTVLGIIKYIALVTVHCSSLWWPPITAGGILNTICFISLSGLTFYHFLSAISPGPGYLPLNWKPEKEKDLDQLQFCGVCQGYKAPRSHHCRKCGRCVLKMDHHCPWLNNCVGWRNHAHFTTFLFFAVLGCFYASVILSCSIYRVIYPYYESGQKRRVPLGLYGFAMCGSTLAMAVVVVLFIGMLLCEQIYAIASNCTAIEDLIVEKANDRREGSNDVFIFPYDLGTRANVKQVANLSCQPVGDGISWPIIVGCDQYTLTREQIEQKAAKRNRTKTYKIVRAASGSWLPITQGFSVCLCPPYSEKPRIKLSFGDSVLVTKWDKYWLYGEKIQPDLPEDQQSIARIRGWFPRRCVEEMVNKGSQNFAYKKRKPRVK